MKIRIKGNSVRLRLTKTEVETFSEAGSLSETTYFGSKALTYCLQSKMGISELEADFIDDIITVHIPAEAQKTWASSNRVGYSNKVDWADDTELSLLVEKDFTCLDETVEDQSDNYPNPRLKP
ncbi:DUF7009 family protein [Croceitalea rosinachiae]|uniref:Uncharacterized protein n=1 Tax=Croceitalea rosinachiae TaxID=3075596 RepID=A0ABU3A8A7_9FLAO|nr:hypothetical protein [Croceitalea sp. F388]MDT0606416.1 hypothetical protein [Croceitalea sp. F388]